MPVGASVIRAHRKIVSVVIFRATPVRRAAGAAPPAPGRITFVAR
ncbi:hypothetical protein AB0F25_36765 [Streptomyces wedmorensis]